MGDRVTVYLEIGGDMRRSQVEEFLRVCREELISVNEFEDGEELTVETLSAATGRPCISLMATECNYGCVDAFEQFMRTRGLPYIKRWDAGYGFPSGVEFFDGERELDWPTIDGEPAIAISDLKGLTQKEVGIQIDLAEMRMPAFRLVDDEVAS